MSLSDRTRPRHADSPVLPMPRGARPGPDSGDDLADRRAERLLRRGVGIAGLIGIALVHVLDLPGKLQETPYLGVGYIGLIVSALVVAEALARADDRRVWLATGGLALATLGGFVVNRTVGMPGAMDDIGNWLEPLGLASMALEVLVIAVAALALVRRED